MLNDLGLTSKDDECEYKMQFVVARYHEYLFYLSLEKKDRRYNHVIAAVQRSSGRVHNIDITASYMEEE